MIKKQTSYREFGHDLKGLKIRWCKKARLTREQKEEVKKDLQKLSDKIIKIMNGTKEEDSRKETAEIRFPLPSIPHLKAYLTVEYCNNAWHIFIETYSNCIGEILREGGPFIKMLKKDEVEEEEAL